ncbi:MAG: hypothetical protein ACLR60_08470 [Clostridium paraputrificum]
MTKIRSSYFLSKESLEYIEEYKKKNNLSSKAIALEQIISEHERNSKIKIKDTAKLMGNEIGKVLEDDIKKFKNSARETDKNVQVLIEMLNGFLLKNENNIIATTTGLASMKKESVPYQIAKEEVAKRIHRNKVKKS